MPAEAPGLPCFAPGFWGAIWEAGVWASPSTATAITFRLDAKLDGVTWTDITSDVVRGSVRHHHGIDGNGPMDVVAGSGELAFALRNEARGARPVGYYSPGHANVRTGWDYGVQVRVVYNDGSDHTRWTGKVSEITPDPNPHGPRTVHVVAYDYQHDLIEADVRAITPQVGQDESTLIGAVLDAIPAAAQPPSRSLASGLDVVPFAFDRLGDRTKAATAIADVVRSSMGCYYTSAAGVGTYKTRQTRFTSSSVATLTDTHISRFSGPTSRAGSCNCVRATYHPKRTVAGIVLWSYTGSTPQVVRAGETVTIETFYRDPDQTSVAIGASSVTSPAAGTDYIAKEFADGTGATVTGDLSVSASSYTTYTGWEITNSGTTDAYLTTWQVRGTGIFDDGDQTVESRSVQAYGERGLDLDLPYQADRHVCYGLATLIREQRENPTTITREVAFTANRSSTLRTLALTAEIAEILTVTNAMTGVSGALCAIQRLEYEYTASGTLEVRVGLAPTSSLVAPPAPTGLAVATVSDSQLSASWTNTDVTAETEVYVDGVLWTIAAPAATSITANYLTRAITYTVTLKHVKYALLRSSATAGVTGRPTILATGGTITTPGDGYKYHDFSSGGTFAITGGGRVTIAMLGGGGGGGGSDAVFIGGGGGGAGGTVYLPDNVEPIGSYAVVIGAGGAGAVSITDATGADGGDTTYRSNTATGGGGGGSFRTGSGGATAGNTGGCGGGGSGDGGAAGTGSQQSSGGAGGAAGSGYRTGGGGGGANGVGGAGVTGGGGGAVGGAGGTGESLIVGGAATGGQGGGPGGASGADASVLACGGAGNLNGDGGDGYRGQAQFSYPI